jgi:hypothetical protein
VRNWVLSHSKDGTSVSLEEVPFWAWAVQAAGDELCYLTEQATGFCFIAPPEWMFRLRWGRLDGDGYTSRNLGSKVWDFGNALLSGFGAWHLQKTIARLPVSYDWVREHQPDAGWPWDGTDDDDE